MNTIRIAAIALEEDAEKKPYLFDSDYVNISIGDLVLVHTRKGYKVGKVISFALVERGSDTADLINCLNRGRRLRKVVVNITDAERDLELAEGERDVSED